MPNVAVIEKGWLGGGNTGRNTTIIRSNYLWDESAALYEHALKLWEDLSAGAELQRHVLAARRDDAGAHRPRRAGLQAPRARQPAATASTTSGCRRRRRRRSARRSTSRPTSAIRSWARPCSGAAARRGTTRWPGAMRARRRRARRRHHPELRGHGDPPRRRRRGRGVETTPRARSAREEGRRRRPPATPRVVMAMAGVRMPLESYPAAGAGVGAGEAGLPLRGDVEHHPRLHLASPTRASSSSAPGTDQYVSYSPARRAAISPAYARGDLRAVPDRSAACACCATGAASSTSRPTARRSSARRRCRACSSTAAGARAASRRRPGPGTCSPQTIAKGEPHPIAAPFTLERFRTGRLIDEAAAAAVAH